MHRTCFVHCAIVPSLERVLNKKRKTTEVKELDINGQLITDDDKIADALISINIFLQLAERCLTRL